MSWFPTRTQSVELLKSVCESCLVVDECLEHALADDSLVGFWGGTSERERRELRRAQPRPDAA